MKYFFSILTVAIAFLLLSSCATTVIPNSVEAKTKLEELGYTVSMETLYGEQVATYGIAQLTTLKAEKGDEYIQAYFFSSQEDTDAFYKIRAYALTENVEVLKKNKYSIYFGTKNAVSDFLS